jgi:site-specific DNA recombinase
LLFWGSTAAHGSRWANAVPYCRCRFPSEYVLANRVEHPLNVPLRQDVMVEPFDDWLAAKFGPATIDQLAATIG